MRAEENFNLTAIQTPIDVNSFESLLCVSKYASREIDVLISGFSEGFSIGYEGPTIRQDLSRNILFTPGVGSPEDLWDKIMDEVAARRVVGPFKQIPFDNFMQLPVGLVPKAGGKTRMIFHLSYGFLNNQHAGSLNHHTPSEICSVKYNDLDQAITCCLKVAGSDGRDFTDLKPLVLAKSDLQRAFRMLPIKKDHWPWLIFKASHPITNQEWFFVDKCLPFGASISCAHFQHFSNALRHLIQFLTGRSYHVVNYLEY